MPNQEKVCCSKLAAAAQYVADTTSGSGSATPLILSFEGRPLHRGHHVMVGRLHGAAEVQSASAVAAVVRLRPRGQAAIRSAPRTFGELHAMLAAEGDDLLGVLRASLRRWEYPASVLRLPFMLVVLVPKVRGGTTTGTVEVTDTWGFVCASTLQEFGAEIGIWESRARDGRPGLLVPPDQNRTADSVGLALGQTFYTLHRGQAATLNGRSAADDRHFVAIGAGTLGSQVVLNATRAAFGQWTTIDDDIFLPHNIARHAFSGDAVGFPKASCLSVTCNSVTGGGAVGIVADVLDPGDRSAELGAAYAAADAIVDFSASVTVARALARDVAVPARRVSVYLNPTGTDLTILAEDAARTVQLDALEMQYYRALTQEPALAGALQLPRERVRYGRSCRDVSAQLPQALAGLHAGIAAKALEQVLNSDEASLRVWRVDPSSLAVQAFDIAPATVRTCLMGTWTIVTDDGLIRRLQSLRQCKLPKETGGVLLGSVDLVRRIVYVVDTIPSPPDSEEWPTVYIRGCVGLEAEVQRISEITAQQLHYVGEWHSHPDGCACRPSNDDAKVFSWLTAVLDEDGLPASMMIVCDGGRIAPFIGEMQDEAARVPELLTVARG